MIVGGVRQWVTYDEIETDNADFGEVGAAFGSVDGERTGSIGEAVCRLMSQRALVDFATTWFGRHRNG